MTAVEAGHDAEQSGHVGGPGRRWRLGLVSGVGRFGRRWRVAAAWTVGCAVLLAFFVKIGTNAPQSSDGATGALEAWQTLHGNVLLHGWILADVTFYTFELPIIALSEVLFGLRDASTYVASAVCYLIVVACSVALAMRGSAGRARLARCAVALAILVIPLTVPYGLWVEIGEPDHMGSAVFFLIPFLLIDRAKRPWYTAPLVGLVLCIGQLGDSTVRYVAVPAIFAVSVYHMAADRRIRSTDAAIAIAAAVSVPAEDFVRAVLRHFGAYLSVVVKTTTKVAPVAQWPHHAALTWEVLRDLFGAVRQPNVPLHGAFTIVGLIALLAAAAGLLLVVVRWRRASRGEQLLCLATICYLGTFMFSEIPTPTDSHEIAGVLPAGAILAARLVVPARVAARARASAVAAAVGSAVALASLVTAATFPRATQPSTDLIGWLEAHHLSYGLSGYWSSSSTTENAGGRVQIRPINIRRGKAVTYDWEMDTSWYDPATNDATFVAVQSKYLTLTVAMAEQAFGTPSYIGKVPGWEILVYHKNLLRQVAMSPLPHVN